MMEINATLRRNVVLVDGFEFEIPGRTERDPVDFKWRVERGIPSMCTDICSL